MLLFKASFLIRFVQIFTHKATLLQLLDAACSQMRFRCSGVLNKCDEGEDGAEKTKLKHQNAVFAQRRQRVSAGASIFSPKLTSNCFLQETYVRSSEKEHLILHNMLFLQIHDMF